MKHTVAGSEELRTDMTASSHVLRVLTQIRNVQSGDVIRVRDHQAPGGDERLWHQVTVQGVRVSSSETSVATDLWPINYVAPSNELVELMEVTRTVKFNCLRCEPQNEPITVTLDDFVDGELMARGGLRAVVLPTVSPEEQTGYCERHAAALLS